MVHIYVSDNVDLNNFFSQYEEFVGLVRVSPIASFDSYDGRDTEAIVIDEFITPMPHWLGKRPPYVLPQCQYTQKNLWLLLKFLVEDDPLWLQNEDSAQPVTQMLSLINHLIRDKTIPHQLIQSLDHQSEYVRLYTKGLISYLNPADDRYDPDTIVLNYIQAVRATDQPLLCLYILFQCVEFLEEIGEIDFIKNLLSEYTEMISTSPRIVRSLFELKIIRADYITISTSGNFIDISSYTSKLEEIISVFEDCELDHYLGLAYTYSCEWHLYAEDYGNALRQVNATLKLYSKLGNEYLMASTSLIKATVLYRWSKSGQPQYYKPAINASQNALKVFKSNTYPIEYGEVQRLIAVIYAEMPNENKAEKNIWSAFSASAYEEALKIFTPDKFAYEYSSVCSNYGTSLIQYPESKTRNNLKRAEIMFEQALKIRTAETLPIERALTLLSKIELLWKLHNENPETERQRLTTMRETIEEIKELISDQETDILEAVQVHEKDIDRLVNV